MAVIEKLRSKAGLLIGIVAFSLVAFILGDFLTSNRSFLGSGTDVAVIGGEKINVQDFEAKVQVEIDNYKLNQNTETVDNQAQEQIREQTWTKVVNEVIMGKQYSKIGIDVSNEELADMCFGKFIHPQIKQSFTDPKTGTFNPANVITFLKTKETNDPTGKTSRQWSVFERAIREERLQQKYNDLIKHGLYITTEEAKQENNIRGKQASLKFVMLNYASIVDSTVQVSDAELNTVYNNNLKRYKQEASRGIDYVVFNVQPSEADRKAALDGITKMVEDFKTTTNDSAFVVANSDEKLDVTYKKKGTLDFQVDSVLHVSPVGTVIGPYERMGIFRLAKLMDSRNMPDSVQARHILLRLDGKKKEDVMKTADSLKTAIQNGTPFAILAMQFSTDDGSKIKGGDLGWFAQGMMVPSFNDACFQGKVGDMPIVESQFGIHLIEITGQKDFSKQIKVAFIDRKVEASSQTYQMVSTKANEFAAQCTTAELFEKGAKEKNLGKLTEANVAENARNVGSIENSRPLVRWAFEANKGEVSKVFAFGDNYVIAVLTGIKEKGYSTLEEVKDQVMAEARKDKKAEMLIEKITKTGSANNVDALAQKLGQTVLTAEGFNFGSPYLANAGYEPRVGGYVVTMKAGATSAPIKGMNGVYVVTVNSFAEPAQLKDFKELKTQMGQTLQQRAQYEVFNALREKANIEDNRGKFY